MLKFLGGSMFNAALVGGVGAAMLAPNGAPARASTPPVVGGAARQLSFVNTHTGDTFSDAYWESGSYIPAAHRGHQSRHARSSVQ